MEYENLLFENQDGIGLVTINRPKALNALNPDVLGELMTLMHETSKDDEVKGVILTGAGEKAFIAGADISVMKDMGMMGAMEFARLGHKTLDFIERLEKPVVAAVNGFALGGGCELAMACDMIIASEGARFGQPEVNLGIIPGFGGTQRLARLVGRARAKELIYTGDMISAQRAYEMGLVVKVTPHDSLMEEAKGMLGRILAKAPFAIRQAKKAIDQGVEVDLNSGNMIERECFALCFQTEDKVEGVSAFLEKRKAEFKGR